MGQKLSNNYETCETSASAKDEIMTQPFSTSLNAKPEVIKVPTFSEILRERARDANINKQKEKEAKEKEIINQLDEYFQKKDFFINIDFAIQNLCNFVLKHAENGHYNLTLKRCYSEAILSKGPCDLGMCEINKVYEEIMNKSEWKEFNSQAKSYFLKWVNVNIDKLISIFESRTKCKCKKDIRSDTMTITITWD
jgi:hypothetical protein